MGLKDQQDQRGGNMYPHENAQELLTFNQSFFLAVPFQVKMKERGEKKMPGWRIITGQRQQKQNDTFLKAICFCHSGYSHPSPFTPLIP